MNDKVAILFITYKRTEIALQCIDALYKNLKHDNIHWHIADDGSPQSHLDALIRKIGPSYTITNAQRYGVGHSMNLGMIECLKWADYILWLEDDWLLTQ